LRGGKLSILDMFSRYIAQFPEPHAAPRPGLGQADWLTGKPPIPQRAAEKTLDQGEEWVATNAMSFTTETVEHGGKGENLSPGETSITACHGVV